MRAPIGAVVSIYYDSDDVVELDHVIHTPTGRTYRVLEVRRQRRGKNVGRYHLRVMVVAGNDIPAGAVVHSLVWYKRDASPPR